MNDVLPVYTLAREASSNNGTLGEILNPDGSHLCYTCERPWLDNTPDTSCIPTGTYSCVPHDSAAHPNVWELQNVPDRSGILIHNGNTENDSEGCIIVGATQGTLGGLPAVLNSNVTLEMLQQTLPLNFTLTITGPDPE
jgi:Family of unknown function (DUF5675)